MCFHWSSTFSSNALIHHKLGGLLVAPCGSSVENEGENSWQTFSLNKGMFKTAVPWNGTLPRSQKCSNPKHWDGNLYRECRQTHKQGQTFYWFATLPQYAHIFPGIVQCYVKKPQSLPAYHDSTSLIAHFLACLWVIPGYVVRDTCEVEDLWRHQGAIQHSHIPRNRINPLKLELVVFTVLCNTQKRYIFNRKNISVIRILWIWVSKAFFYILS